MSVPCLRARRLLVAYGCDFPELDVVAPNPAAYRRVLELELRESRVVGTIDHSLAMERRRAELREHGDGWIGVDARTGFSFTAPGLQEQPPLTDPDCEPPA